MSHVSPAPPVLRTAGLILAHSGFACPPTPDGSAGKNAKGPDFEVPGLSTTMQVGARDQNLKRVTTNNATAARQTPPNKAQKKIHPAPSMRLTNVSNANEARVRREFSGVSTGIWEFGSFHIGFRRCDGALEKRSFRRPRAPGAAKRHRVERGLSLQPHDQPTTDRQSNSKG